MCVLLFCPSVCECLRKRILRVGEGVCVDHWSFVSWLPACAARWSVSVGPVLHYYYATTTAAAPAAAAVTAASYHNTLYTVLHY